MEPLELSDISIDEYGNIVPHGDPRDIIVSEEGDKSIFMGKGMDLIDVNNIYIYRGQKSWRVLRSRNFD